MNWFRYIWLKIVGDKCPTCKRKYHDLGNIMAIYSFGECGRCDHVRGEVNDQMRDEARDVEAEMQNDNNDDPSRFDVEGLNSCR